MQRNMTPNKSALVFALTTKWIPLLCLILTQNAFAWERYQSLEDKGLEVVVKRDKADPRYTFKGWDGEVKIKNEKMFPFDKFGGDELERDIFSSGKAPADSECYFTPIMMTICWVPVGTKIGERGSATDAFRTKTGVVMCVDSVAGRGACMDLRQILTSEK